MSTFDNNIPQNGSKNGAERGWDNPTKGLLWHYLSCRKQCNEEDMNDDDDDCRDTSLKTKPTTLGPYSGPMPKALEHGTITCSILLEPLMILLVDVTV